MRIRLGQRGDTIMEVLIAVAVLSLVLTASYAVANRSSIGNRQAQERSEGFKETESQLELLKTYLSGTPTPSLPTSGNFCMKKNGGGPITISGSIPSDPQADTSFIAIESNPDAQANCKKDGAYYTYIERNGNTFTVHTRWLRAATGGVEESTMVHRIYPDMAAASLGTGTVITGCPINHFMNSLGGCTICPNGYSSPGGFTTSCLPIKPVAKVNVQKARPLAGNGTPSCSAPAGTENRAGTQTKLTKASGGEELVASTGTDSIARYELPTIPSDTYLASVTIDTTKFEVCPPQTRPVTPMGYGPAPGVGQEQTVNLLIRPLCYSVDDYGWVDNGSWYDANADRHADPVAYWWEHTGPDWGWNGPPKSNPRFGIGNAKDGYPQTYWTNAEGSVGGTGNYAGQVEYRLYNNSPDGWYNRFELRWSYSAHIPIWAWASNWQWQKVGAHNECPN